MHENSLNHIGAEDAPPGWHGRYLAMKNPD